MNVLERLAMFCVRRRVLAGERLRLRELEKTIETIRGLLAQGRALRTPHAERIWNIGLFVLVVERDVAVLRRAFLSEHVDWDRRYSARQLAVLLYEVSEDLPELLGREFRECLRALDAPDSIVASFNTAHSGISKFKAANSVWLGDVRNLITAHRDHDGLRQLEAIEHLDPLQVYKVAGDFYEHFRGIIGALTALGLHLAEPRVILKQLLGRDPQTG